MTPPNATVVCVLRSGGVYGPEWVAALVDGVQRLHPSTRVVCLTDMELLDPTRCETVPLIYDLPGWWSKLELFRPGLFHGPVLYLDLDTLVTGDLSELLAYKGDFAMLSGFYRPDWAESGVMAWTPGPHTERVWAAFMADPQHAIAHVKRDGRFIADHVRCERLQELFPGQIVSLKVHARKACPEGARLVCAHGHPKFHEPAAGWAHDVWRAA